MERNRANEALRSRRLRRNALLAAGAVMMISGAVGAYYFSNRSDMPVGSGGKTPVVGKVVARYQPPRQTSLVTNEYATYNSDDPAAKKSPDWTMTSGSLFAKNGAFWTGKPDSCDSPDAASANCTNSNVFRLNTARTFSGNLSVGVTVRQNKDIHNAHCNDGDTCWHGAHIWLDYQSEYNLYYVSVNRADDNVVIKRKVPCGDDNDGTYFELSRYVHYPFTSGKWNSYRAALQHNTDGSNTVSLYDAHNKQIVSGVDRGGINPNWSESCSAPGKYRSAAYQPLPMTGNVGLRGDFTDMSFTDFTISQQ